MTLADASNNAAPLAPIEAAVRTEHRGHIGLKISTELLYNRIQNRLWHHAVSLLGSATSLDAVFVIEVSLTLGRREGYGEEVAKKKTARNCRQTPGAAYVIPLGGTSNCWMFGVTTE